MDEANKAAELKDEELNEVSGGQWQPNLCKGYVIGTAYVNGYNCNVYKIGSGDTLSQIAYSLSNGDYNKLARFNGIQNVNYIQAGQIIYVPIGNYNA